MKAFTRVATLHRSTHLLVAGLACLLVACGGGSNGGDIGNGGNGGGTGGGTVRQQTISGRVFAGDAVQAAVCLDQNRNGRCEADETPSRTDASGNYSLTIAQGTTAPLVAQADGAYRMASPSVSYSTNLTPYTTLVHLTGEADLPLAEDLVRDVVGLPPRFKINSDSPAPAGTLRSEIAKSIAAALKAVDGTLNMADGGALRTVAAAFPPALTDLPVLRIDTKDGAPVDSTQSSVEATFALTNPAISTASTTLLGTIRGRGHSTWGQPKNPYRIEFDKNDPGLDALADVLGMTKNRNWVMLADYFDRSLMRNKLALALGGSSVFADGMKWNPSGQHLEAYLNGDYIGVYVLAEDIRISHDRLDIKAMGKNDVDGGYIVEVDTRFACYDTPELSLQHLTPQGVPFCIDTPSEANITASQLSYIKNLLNQVENDIYRATGVEGINSPSYVDWYLVNELFRNVDANFRSSVFMWKDSASANTASDRVLNMGPIWDFDRAAGNADYNDAWKPEGCWVNQATLPNWVAKLLENPSVLNLTLTRWKQKRAAIERFVNASIDTYARRLDAAQQRNFARWPVLGVPLSGHYTFATYGEEVRFLKSFLNDRMTWLDKAFASADSYQAMCK